MDSATSRLERTLQAYDEPLLRQVAGKLIKPRNVWPAGELIERCLAAFENFATIDRRLQELDPFPRRLLTLMGHSGQPRWRVIHLVELLTALGDPDGLQSVRLLLEAGLLFPELPEAWKRLRSWNQWFTQAGSLGPEVFTHPNVMVRAVGEDLHLPRCPLAEEPVGGVHEADGLEWPLRLAVVWQLAASEPFRRTQQGDFFKRDQERLRNDAVLGSPPAEGLEEFPEAAFFATELALALGILQEANGELRAVTMPASWNQGLLPTLAFLWSVLPRALEAGSAATHNPWPSASLLALIGLSRLPEGAWARPLDVEHWVFERHPFWKKATEPRASANTARLNDIFSPISRLLLSIAFQLRMVQAAKTDNGKWVVRLSSTGRALLNLGSMPALPPTANQTLLVQPNLEIVAYRQGMTPSLIARLSQFAAWKSLGAACLLQLQPETVYRALESGLTFEDIRQTLEQYGTRPTPTVALDLMRTWTAKRERLTLFPSATLLEFAQSADLNEALARGLPATRLSDRLAVVPNENAIDFRHFRLSGTRDYGLPPEQCVEVEEDGITLAVDSERADLLVEIELRRFAEHLEHLSGNGKRRFRVTAASLRLGENGGLGIYALEEWFQQRAGRPLSPAIRLLMTAPFQSAVEFKRPIVLQVGSAEVAEGLLQLPETRGRIQTRLGPTALTVNPEHVEELRRQLEQLGLAIQDGFLVSQPVPPNELD